MFSKDWPGGKEGGGTAGMFSKDWPGGKEGGVLQGCSPSV